MKSFLILSFAILAGGANSFMNNPPFLARTLTKMHLGMDSIAGRHFQLEEREDKDSATSDIQLNADGSVSFGETDGPLPVGSTGSWAVEDDKFHMMLVRKFVSGGEGATESNLLNRIDEFDYDVPMSFKGDLATVGGKIAVNGKMISTDEKVGDREVGFFSLLDTTDDLLGNDE